MCTAEVRILDQALLNARANGPLRSAFAFALAIVPVDMHSA
jgi:hypothetical protein